MLTVPAIKKKKTCLYIMEILFLLGKTTLPNFIFMEKFMTQEKTNRNYKDSVFVDLLKRGI